jgi:hypothetical protein
MTTPREAGDARIGDALRRHYIAHDLPADGGASDPWFRVHIGPVTLRLPNPPARRRAVFFHDVNHVVAGYDTSFSGGEMAIAAFEVGSGCGPFAIVWYINLSMFGLGLAVTPRAVFRAFVRGRHAASIYHRRENSSALSAMTVAKLRAELGLDQPIPAASLLDRLTFLAWAAAAVVVMIAPFAVVVAALSAGLRGLITLWPGGAR